MQAEGIHNIEPVATSCLSPDQDQTLCCFVFVAPDGKHSFCRWATCWLAALQHVSVMFVLLLLACCSAGMLSGHVTAGVTAAARLPALPPQLPASSPLPNCLPLHQPIRFWALAAPVIRAGAAVGRGACAGRHRGPFHQWCGGCLVGWGACEVLPLRATLGACCLGEQLL